MQIQWFIIIQKQCTKFILLKGYIEIELEPPVVTTAVDFITSTPLKPFYLTFVIIDQDCSDARTGSVGRVAFGPELAWTEAGAVVTRPRSRDDDSDFAPLRVTVQARHDLRLRSTATPHTP